MEKQYTVLYLIADMLLFDFSVIVMFTQKSV